MGSIQCFNGELNDVSFCVERAAQVSIKSAAKVFGTFGISIEGSPSKTAIATSVAESLGVLVSSVSIEWELKVERRRLLRGHARRLADNQYKIKYEVLVLDDGPSEAQILSRAADIGRTDSAAQQQLTQSMADAGLSASDIREVFSPVAYQSVAVMDRDGDVVVLKKPEDVAPSLPPAQGAGIQEEASNLPIIVGGIVGGVLSIVAVSGVVWYFLAKGRKARA